MNPLLLSLLVGLAKAAPDLVVTIVGILHQRGILKPEEIADLLVRIAKPGESYFPGKEGK